MSDSKNTGGPAFPHETYHGVAAPGSGMTLRDWFAGQALSSMSVGNDVEWFRQIGAKRAYLIADAMIAARAAE